MPIDIPQEKKNERFIAENAGKYIGGCRPTFKQSNDDGDGDDVDTRQEYAHNRGSIPASELYICPVLFCFLISRAKSNLICRTRV